VAVANDHVSTPLSICVLRCGLSEFCIVVFILAITAQLMSALHEKTKVRKLLRLSSRPQG
jgi:hypothetical protein